MKKKENKQTDVKASVYNINNLYVIRIFIKQIVMLICFRGRLFYDLQL